MLVDLWGLEIELMMGRTNVREVLDLKDTKEFNYGVERGIGC